MSTTESLAAIRKTLTVDASVETAFETFTRRMGDWWPGGAHTVFDDRVAVVFEELVGGRVYERSADGQEADWADVLAWEPPHRLVLRWRVNPNRGPTEIEVRFVPDGDATRVELEHRGWDRAGDAEGRAMYDSGWDTVLGGYTESLSRWASSPPPDVPDEVAARPRQATDRVGGGADVGLHIRVFACALRVPRAN